MKRNQILFKILYLFFFALVHQLVGFAFVDVERYDWMQIDAIDTEAYKILQRHDKKIMPPYAWFRPYLH